MLIAMRKKPTFKQKTFAQEYVTNKGNGTQAALKAYNPNNKVTASAIAVENLEKPLVRQEINRVLREQGVTVKRAAAAVADGLACEEINSRLRAADMTLKLLDVYPHKRVTDHRHAHLHVAMLQGLENLEEGELESIIEETSK